ncbi:hypothetical protein FOVSG1_011983 [Fusarium oxysporum f. sp. vasinfectum]
MGLCNACTQGLRNVYQQRASRPNHGFKIVHAPHNQDTCQACWICHKYSIWLEDHYPETLHAWRSAPLYSIFRYDSEMITPKDATPEENWRIVSLGFTVQPLGFSSQDATLGVSVRLMSDQEYRSYATGGPQVPQPTSRLHLVGIWLTQSALAQNLDRDNELWDDDIENAPLQSRGWVFQERFLSPRILHFAERQIAWECGEISALEMFPKRVPPGLLKASRKDVIDNLLSAKAITNENLIDFRRTWDDTVHKYTKTDLTFSNDKLIAFAGLAKAIEGLRNDTYLAGLWKSAFIYQLAWTRTRYDAVQQPLELSSGRAPSWSWLSVDGEILLSQAQKPRKHFASVVELPDTNCAGSSAIAASGSVLLQGTLLPIDSIEWDDDVLSEFNISGLTLKDGWTFNDIHLDLEGTKEQILQLQKSGIALLPLFATDEHMQCIAVTGVNVPGSMSVVFRRVGACQIEYRKLHIPNQGSQEGWIEDPSTVFLPGEPSHNLLHPVARSVIRIAEVNIALDSRLIRLI